MEIIPRGEPVVTGLNSYYLKIKQLLEHYQGEIGSGGIFFTAASGKGVVFFDQDEILSGYFQNRKEELSGRRAIDYLLDLPGHVNFSVSVYAIDPEDVYFWTSISSATIMYDNLSSEFTDIKALLRKLAQERLTGYIDVAIKNGDDRGMLFFQNGRIMGDSYSWTSEPDDEARNLLMEKTKSDGGIFRVFRIDPGQVASAAAAAAQEPPTADLAPEQTPAKEDILPLLATLLYVLERIVDANKKIRVPFSTLLKKKFIDKADRYSFLDPFAAEFEYKDRRIHYSGTEAPGVVIEAVTASVSELAHELGLHALLVQMLEPWFKKFAEQIERYQIRV
ncbi:MAG: hypothetical protein QNJ22_00455 [Desulfosarcinaceae bacterium]|nr:hypothetical protein [Desulfosarcinaceae bacterium]